MVRPLACVKVFHVKHLPPNHANLGRRYTDADAEHIALILRLKNADFSLDEILGYTTIRDQGATTIPERLHLMQVKIDQLHQKQLTITASIDYLHGELLGCKRPSFWEC